MSFKIESSLYKQLVYSGNDGYLKSIQMELQKLKVNSLSQKYHQPSILSC